MIIESIRNYFIDCPILDELRKIGVDYLEVNDRAYTIDPVPSDNLIKKYVDGSSIKQYLFVVASREFYGAGYEGNIENIGFYEKLSTWIDKQNKKHNLPVLSGNKESIELEVVTSGYLFGADENNARYQIQLRLKYYEE